MSEVITVPVIELSQLLVQLSDLQETQKQMLDKLSDVEVRIAQIEQNVRPKGFKLWS